MNPTSRDISFKYHWFYHNIGEAFVIWKIESENQKSDIFTKGLQAGFFSGLESWYAVGKPSYERECSGKWNLQP